MTPPHSEEHNRRRFHRILFDAPVSISDANGSHLDTVIDISLKGALIGRPPNWSGSINDEVELDVKLGDGELHIRMEGSVAHIEEGQLGIQCNKIDIDSISHLRRLAELNLGDADLVERELDALG